MDCPRCFKILAILILGLAATSNQAAAKNQVDKYLLLSPPELSAASDGLVGWALKALSFPHLSTGPAYLHPGEESVSLKKLHSSPYFVFTISDSDGLQGNLNSARGDDEIAASNVTRKANVDLFKNASYRVVRSSNNRMDGVIVPTRLTGYESKIDAYQNDPALEQEIFDGADGTEDPYWAYYGDIEQWGVVLSVQLPLWSSNSINWAKTIEQEKTPVRQIGFVKTRKNRTSFFSAIKSRSAEKIQRLFERVIHTVDLIWSKMESRYGTQKIPLLNQIHYSFAHSGAFERVKAKVEARRASYLPMMWAQTVQLTRESIETWKFSLISFSQLWESKSARMYRWIQAVSDPWRSHNDIHVMEMSSCPIEVR